MRCGCTRHAICIRTGPRRGSRPRTQHGFPYSNSESLLANSRILFRASEEGAEGGEEGRKNEALKRRAVCRPYYSVNITFVTWRGGRSTRRDRGYGCVYFAFPNFLRETARVMSLSPLQLSVFASSPPPVARLHYSHHRRIVSPSLLAARLIKLSTAPHSQARDT